MELRDRTRAQDAWTALWRDPQSRLACIGGAPEIAATLRARWAEFAARLGVGARVLDLGCGVGAASGALLAARRDLKLTGIDFADVPAADGGGMTVLRDTPMESMPFAPSSFDAAISQFGFEYGRTHKTAQQLARVLASGARFAFVVHHAESSVVAVNRARLNAILAALGPAMRGAFLSGRAFALDAKLQALRLGHPGDALVAELARILPGRARVADKSSRAAAWRTLEAALSPELTILEAMDSCCVAPEELEGWLGPLRQLGVVTAASVLCKPDGAPIAWCIEGARAA